MARVRSVAVMADRGGTERMGYELPRVAAAADGCGGSRMHLSLSSRQLMRSEEIEPDDDLSVH